MNTIILLEFLLLGVEPVLDVLVVLGGLEAAAGPEVSQLAEALHHGRARPAHLHTPAVAPTVLILRAESTGTGH